MILYQVGAAFNALIMTLVFALVLIRRPSPNFVVAGAQLLPIPAAGFAFFAVDPGPEPSFTIVVASAALVVVAAVCGVFSGRLIRRMRSAPFTSRTLTLHSRLTLTTRVFLVLGLTGYLLAFEPWFAVANVAANGLWALVWLLPRWRQAAAQVSIEIPIPPERVRAFAAQPSNWPRYDVDLDDVVVAPPGPLKVGSTITALRRIRVMMPRAGIVVGKIQTHSIVTAATAESTTIVDRERGTTTVSEVRAEGLGSRVSNQARFVLSVSQGIDGLAFQMPWILSEYRNSTEQSLARLRELLTAPG